MVEDMLHGLVFICHVHSDDLKDSTLSFEFVPKVTTIDTPMNDSSEEYIPGESQELTQEALDSHDQPTDLESEAFGTKPNWPPEHVTLWEMREHRSAADRTSLSFMR